MGKFSKVLILTLLIIPFQNCADSSLNSSMPLFGSSISSSGQSALPPNILPQPNLSCDEGPTGGAYLPNAGAADLITIDATKIVRTICPEFWGINHSPAYDSLWNLQSTADALLPLGFNVGRYWGGSGGDWINWSNFPNNFGVDFPTPLAAWNTISKSGIKKLIIQSNPTAIGGNDPSGVPITAAVKYFKNNNIPVFSMEVGNEQDNTNAQDTLPMNQYSAAFTAQCSAARAVDPNFSCMGPVSTNDWFWWPTNGGTNSPNTLENFLALQGNKNGTGLVDKISLHWYPGYDLNRVQGEFSQAWPLILGAIKKYDTRNLPVYFTEFSVSSTDGKNAWVGSAIQVADMLQAFKLYGVGGVDYFTIHKVNPPYNWGILQASDEASPNSPSAVYYSMYLINKMGPQVLNVVQGQDRAVISTHASLAADGSLQVMVLNKSAVAKPLRIAFNGFDPRGYSVSNYSLIGGTESQTNVQFNGVTMPKPTSLPPPSDTLAAGSILNLNVEAFSIRLINIHR